jgi:hypothetical protein
MLFDQGGMTAEVVSGAPRAGASLKEIECRKFHLLPTLLCFLNLAIPHFGQPLLCCLC